MAEVTRTTAAWVTGISGISAIAGVCWLLDERIGGTVTAALLLVPIIVASALGGARIGVWVAAIGAVSYAALFLAPLGHVRVGPTQDVLTLVAFVAVAFGVGTISDRRRPAPETPAATPSASDDLLLNAVSHDLRNPLSTIRLASADLLTGAHEDDGERRTELLGLVLSESERLDRIVGNLLSAGRVRAGALMPSTSPCSIGSLLDTTAERAERIGTSLLVVDVEADLPEVLIDPVLIDQVVTNLVENAARVSPADAPIVIAARRCGDVVEVEVVDRGPGFDPDMRADAFEPHLSASGSTGLGLAVCKAVIDAHGGTITIGDEPDGAGASVRFTLPIAPT